MIQANELRLGNWIYNPVQKINFQVDIQTISNVWYDNQKRDTRNEDLYYQPITLTEELLLKCVFCGQELELWNENKLNDNEYHKRYVFHNVIDGTSNLEIHVIHHSCGKKKYIIYQLSIDYDERQGFKDLEYLHQLQNGVRWLTGEELEINL